MLSISPRQSTTLTNNSPAKSKSNTSKKGKNATTTNINDSSGNPYARARSLSLDSNGNANPSSSDDSSGSASEKNPPLRLHLSKGAIRRRRLRSNGKLRIVIVCENFLPNIDGVTRCLTRLLEHLRKEGHECILLGPESGMDRFMGFEIVGTWGLPLWCGWQGVYPNLKLNFLRPHFLRKIVEMNPDVIHVVDPIWLGAQTIWALNLGLAGSEWANGTKPIIASYHTNMPLYASLFGFPGWFVELMWILMRNLHSKCVLTACPTQSTKDMIMAHGIENVRLWPRGVDVSVFNKERRDYGMRERWGVPKREAVVQSSAPEAAAKESGAGGMTGNGGAVLGGGQAGIGSGASAGGGGHGHGHDQAQDSPIQKTHSHHSHSHPHPHPPHSPTIPPTQSQTPGNLLTPPPSPIIPPLEDDNVCVILYVGRLSSEKNLTFLLHSYATLLKRLSTSSPAPSSRAGDSTTTTSGSGTGTAEEQERSSSSTSCTRLVFVGDGPARSALESLSAELGTEAIFEGHVSDPEQLAGYYASADIFAFPSYTETFGQVICEALASGLPVVGLDAPGTRDLVGHDEKIGALLKMPPLPGLVAPGSSIAGHAHGRNIQAQKKNHQQPMELPFTQPPMMPISPGQIASGPGPTPSQGVYSHSPPPLSSKAQPAAQSQTGTGSASSHTTPESVSGQSSGKYAHEWRSLVRDPTSPAFKALSAQYASLLEDLVLDSEKRRKMGEEAAASSGPAIPTSNPATGLPSPTGSTDSYGAVPQSQTQTQSQSVGGKTWHDAMECAVNAYREAIEICSVVEDEEEERKAMMERGEWEREKSRILGRGVDVVKGSFNSGKKNRGNRGSTTTTREEAYWRNRIALVVILLLVILVGGRLGMLHDEGLQG